MAITAEHRDHDPLHRARLELSELRAGIEDLADPDQREQLALAARTLGAYLHAATVQATQDRAALGPERATWLAAILRSWSPRQLAGLRPDTTDDPLAPTSERWALRAALLAAQVATRWYRCEHPDCPEPGSEATESGERYCPTHFSDAAINIGRK